MSAYANCSTLTRNMIRREALMNCNGINQALDEECMAAPLPPEAEEHVRSCARCRELVAALSAPVPGASPAAAILRQIEKSILADLRPVRPIAPKFYLWGALMAIFISVVALGVYRTGAFALAVMSPLQAGVILCGLAIDRKSTRLNSSHQIISYAVFCLKKNT